MDGAFVSLLREFMRAAARKLGYIAALALVAYVVAIGDAKAATYNTISEAWQACQEAKATYSSGYPGSYCLNDSANLVVRYKTADGGGIVNFSYAAGCPAGKQFNEVTGTCDDKCPLTAPPLQNITLSVQAGSSETPWEHTPPSTCNAGCAYDGDVGDQTRFIIDGQQYVTYSVMHPRGETCTAGSGSGFGSPATPPPDGDGDGSSDGNDGSPNNPGSSSGTSGESGSNGPSGSNGSGSGEDGSNACGGPGQPVCPVDGSGKGSGNGNTAGGGGDCSTRPTGSGDALLAMVAYQAWATRCAVENIKSTGITIIGGGAGNGEGGAGTLGTCTDVGSVAAFACTGDPVGCIQAEAAAIQRCREHAKDKDNNGIPDWAQGDNPEIPGDGDGDYEETAFGIDVGTDLLDTEEIFGSGSCPQFVLNSGKINFNSSDIPAWCTIVAIMRAVVLLVAAYAAIRILLGGN